jgi:hypothetical protein
MRKVHPLAFLVLFAATACGSQRQTGEALVVAGAVTTAVGAQSASSSHCTSFGCTAARVPSSAGTKVALAGAAVAAGGYALMATAPRGDQKVRTAMPPDPTNAWRLQRKTPIEPETTTAREGAPAPEAAPATAPETVPTSEEGPKK